METMLVECKPCKATGIFQGNYERGEVGIVCRECKGSGSLTLEYIPFTGRVERHDINRVFMRSGHVIDDHIHGGVSYQQWLDDNGSVYKPENALRELHCPRLYTNHTPHEIFDHNIPLWQKCDKAITPGKSIYDCRHFCDKAACWKQFDEEVKELK